MKLEEYLKYYNFIQGAVSYGTLVGDSIEDICIARAKAVVALARVGYEHSKANSCIRNSFLKIRSEGSVSIEDAKKLADKEFEDANEISYSDLATLIESIGQFINACAGRQRALEAEFRGTQRGEI